MTDSAACINSPVSPARAPSPLVVERWADLARCLALYPETNTKVLQASAAFFDALRDAVDPREKSAEIGFSTKHIWLGRKAFDFKPDGGLVWLKERLDKADVCGVIFSDNVEESAVIAFNKKLLELFRSREADVSFETRWAEQYPGITLLERRFDGTFTDLENAEGAGCNPAIGARAGRKAMRDALSLNARISDTIARIEAKVVPLATTPADVRRIDLLAEIVELLPAEGLHDYATAATLAEKLLSDLEAELDERNTDGSPGRRQRHAALRRVLFELARNFGTIDTTQSRQDTSAPPSVTSPDSGSVSIPAPPRRDEEIQDDRDALMAEVAALPSLEAAPNRDAGISDPSEEFGVFLHYLVRLEDPGKAPALNDGLKRLLVAAGEPGMEVARAYLDPAPAVDLEIARASRAKVATWLRKNGQRDYLERCGVFDASWVCTRFPEEFIDYVETLDLASAHDQKEFDGVCRKIGPERFVAAAERLAGATAFLAGAVPERLFELPFRSVNAFLRLIFDTNRPRFRMPFARFLRATTINTVDRSILDMASGEPSLPHAYLHALSDNDAARLVRERGVALRAFLSAIEGDPDRLVKNVEAIRLLGSFDCPATRAFLYRLAHERTFFIFGRHPRIARRAAAKVLRALESRSEVRRV